MESSDHALIGAAVTAALGLAKVLEALVVWVMKKMKNGTGLEKTPLVQLDPETSRMLRETYERSGHVYDITSRTDNDGVPLVYNPRSAIETQGRIAEALRDMGHSCERIAESTEETAVKVRELAAAAGKK